MLDKKCVCNGKNICCEMQKASMKKSIEALKNATFRSAYGEIILTLIDILKVYDCKPAECLKRRLLFYKKHLHCMSNNGAYVSIDMLIAELETFINS